MIRNLCLWIVMGWLAMGGLTGCPKQTTVAKKKANQIYHWGQENTGYSPAKSYGVMAQQCQALLFKGKTEPALKMMSRPFLVGAIHPKVGKVEGSRLTTINHLRKLVKIVQKNNQKNDPKLYQIKKSRPITASEVKKQPALAWALPQGGHEVLLKSPKDETNLGIYFYFNSQKKLVAIIEIAK